MYNICTLLFKDKRKSIKYNKVVSPYDETWVQKIYNMVERNCTKPFNFYCITDQYISNTNIKTITIDKDQLTTYDKLFYFKEGLLPNNPTVFFDLDVVILNNIEKLFDYHGLRMVHKLARNFEAGLGDPHNGSVIKWNPSKSYNIFEKYINTPKDELPETDDEFLTNCGAHPFSINDCVCYTANKTNLYWWDKPYQLNKEHTVVCFNKHSDKQDHYQQESKWIKDYWF